MFRYQTNACCDFDFTGACSSERQGGEWIGERRISRHRKLTGGVGIFGAVLLQQDDVRRRPDAAKTETFGSRCHRLYPVSFGDRANTYSEISDIHCSLPETITK